MPHLQLQLAFISPAAPLIKPNAVPMRLRTFPTWWWAHRRVISTFSFLLMALRLNRDTSNPPVPFMIDTSQVFFWHLSPPSFSQPSHAKCLKQIGKQKGACAGKVSNQLAVFIGYFSLLYCLLLAAHAYGKKKICSSWDKKDSYTWNAFWKPTQWQTWQWCNWEEGQGTLFDTQPEMGLNPHALMPSMLG